MEAGPGRRGEFAFRVGGREIGHLHGSHTAHFAFPKQLWRELREQERISPHPVFPRREGLAARRIEDDGDIRDVIELLRLNYDRTPPPTAHVPKAYVQASEDLHEQLEFEEIQGKVALAWIQRPRARADLATLATLSDEQLDSEQLTRVLARGLGLPEAEVEFELVMLVFHDSTTDVLAAQGLQRRAAIRSASRSIVTTDSEAGDRATGNVA